jgi:DNA-binding transcriptional ArsR family regulator
VVDQALVLHVISAIFYIRALKLNCIFQVKCLTLLAKKYSIHSLAVRSVCTVCLVNMPGWGALARMDIELIKRNVTVGVGLLKALSNERRLVIVCALYEGEKSVGELERIVGLSQSALSQHLARLRRDGLVKTRREAQTIYYSLCDAAIESILKSLYDIYCKNPS